MGDPSRSPTKLPVTAAAIRPTRIDATLTADQLVCWRQSGCGLASVDASLVADQLADSDRLIVAIPPGSTASEVTRSVAAGLARSVAVAVAVLVRSVASEIAACIVRLPLRECPTCTTCTTYPTCPGMAARSTCNCRLVCFTTLFPVPNVLPGALGATL